jgi:hypothetical protein
MEHISPPAKADDTYIDDIVLNLITKTIHQNIEHGQPMRIVDRPGPLDTLHETFDIDGKRNSRDGRVKIAAAKDFNDALKVRELAERLIPSVVQALVTLHAMNSSCRYSGHCYYNFSMQPRRSGFGGLENIDSGDEAEKLRQTLAKLTRSAIRDIYGPKPHAGTVTFYFDPTSRTSLV